MHVWSKLSSEKWRDAWEERFHAVVDTSLVITEFPNKKKIRIEAYCKTKHGAEKIQEKWGGSVRKLVNRDWVAFSPPEIRPIKIRDSFVVTPETNPKKLADITAENPGRQLLNIPAEMAFGTGDHATTATCLRILCDLLAQNELPEKFSCLDLGCGTGILGIAAKKSGASHVLGVDFDSAAVRISKKNVTANALSARSIKIIGADVLKWEPPEKFDLVYANLFSDVLAAAFPMIRKKALAKNGRLVVSGILQDHAPECLDAARNAGLDVRETRPRGKWVTAILTHRPKTKT
ncbi:MAG: 50S ribosomal protein L11 methyltransferase [Verrucomicrobiales bacterium]|nr:50S ribosomal protein L11 methyltransferase [Verrucomicrobiales bacterium]